MMPSHDAAKLHESEIRRHYTLVCQCDYSDDHDFDERIATSSECVMHGDEPDPLFSLLAEYERLRQAEDRLLGQTGDRADAVPADNATYHVLRALVYAVLDVSTALEKIAGPLGIVTTRDADRV